MKHRVQHNNHQKCMKYAINIAMLSAIADGVTYPIRKSMNNSLITPELNIQAFLCSSVY